MDIKTFFKFGREDFSKETYLYFILALAFIVIALGALAFYLFYVFRGMTESQSIPIVKNEIEEALKTLGSPNGPESSAPESVLNSLGSSGKDAPKVSEDVLKSLGSVSK
jgi:hypothetical protein